jgi:hypothetical protein
VPGRPIVLVVLVLSALLASRATFAETVYKCLAASQVIYQQTPCAKTQRQQTIQLADPAPAATRPLPMDAPPAGETTQAPEAATAFAPSAAPPPRLYGCVRATDGKPYTRPDGNTEPYLAPSGVVGDFGGTLSDAYTGRNAAIASAPELNRGKGNVGVLTNANYIWVQDTCRRLSVDETCRVLRDESDANRKALRNAFKSDRPPLEARDAALTRQLAGCG